MLPLCVAVLDTMWIGRVQRAPRWFIISGQNKSGARLYKLVEPAYRLRVTNACKYTVMHSHEHGKPDPKWLEENLLHLAKSPGIDLLLVCGSVAQDTFSRTCLCTTDTAWRKSIGVQRVMLMLHPAYRGWTMEMLEHTRNQIQGDKS